MKIYSINPDVERYQQLCYDEKEFNLRYSELTFNGDPKSQSWKPPHVEWIEGPPVGSTRRKLYIKPDIAYLAGDLALNTKATNLLRPLFGAEAEFLSISVDNEEWTLLNVTNMQDALDKANSRYKIRSDGTVGRMLEMALDKTQITNARLFRLVGKPSKLFTDDTPDSFKEIVEGNKVTGLTFDEC